MYSMLVFTLISFLFYSYLIIWTPVLSVCSEKISFVNLTNFSMWPKFAKFHYESFEKTYIQSCDIPISKKCFKQILFWSFRLSQKKNICLSKINMLYLDNFPRWTLHFEFPTKTNRKRHVYLDNISFLYLVFATLAFKTMDDSCVNKIPFEVLASHLFKINFSQNKIETIFQDLQNHTEAQLFSRENSEQLFSFTNFIYYFVYNRTDCKNSISKFFYNSVNTRNVSTPFGVTNFSLVRGIMSPIQSFKGNLMFLENKTKVTKPTAIPNAVTSEPTKFFPSTRGTSSMQASQQTSSFPTTFFTTNHSNTST